MNLNFSFTTSKMNNKNTHKRINNLHSCKKQTKRKKQATIGLPLKKRKKKKKRITNDDDGKLILRFVRDKLIGLSYYFKKYQYLSSILKLLPNTCHVFYPN